MSVLVRRAGWAKCIQAIICKVSIYAMSMWAASPRSAPPRHSPSLRAQSKGCGEVLHLGGGQCLGEGVSHHVVRQAIDEPDGTLFDNPADPVVPHVDVLRARVVLVIACECDGRLIVGEQSGGGCDGAENLGDEAAKPQGLLAAMRRRDVLALGGGQGDDLLSLR